MKQDRNGLGTDRDGERARWVNKYRRSGLGLKRFAQRHGLKAGQLHYWVYGLDQPKVSEPPASVFQEVRLPTSLAAPALWDAEVGLADGITVRLGRGTEVAWALSLIESLRRPCSR